MKSKVISSFLMKYLKPNTNRMRFQLLLLLSFLIPLILVFFSASYGSYRQVSNKMTEELLGVARLSSEQINKNVDSYIKDRVRLTNISISDNHLQNLLSIDDQVKSQSEQYNNDSYILNFLFNIYSLNPDLYSITLVTKSGRKYSEGVNRYINNIDFYQNEIYLMLKNDFDNICIIGPRYAETHLSNVPVRVFTIARKIVDISGNTLGIIVLNSKYKSFVNLFAEVEAGQSARIFLLSETGALYYDSNTLDVSNSDLNNLTTYDEKEIQEILNDTQNYYRVTNESEYTNFKVFLSIPKHKIYTNINVAFYSVELLIAICFVFSIFVYLIISSYISSPLKELTALIKQVENGNLSVRMKVKGSKEIADLCNGFNSMVSKTKSLIKNIVEVENLRKEAEYKAFQSQINPHFLYNTLEVIRMRCIVKKELQTADAIETLGYLFRMCIDNNENFITLREELEHIKNYLKIHNFRFENKYIFNIKIADDIYNYKLLKLTLQPIVENCITHGLEMKQGYGHITVEAHTAENTLVITVADDGLGMSKESCDELNLYIENSEIKKENGGIGLKNVNKRIQLYHGNNYGIKISSRKDRGTIVTIRIPIITWN
jgi:two-component system sensor histidine kinase YesM